jgi:hypothetical protein
MSYYSEVLADSPFAYWKMATATSPVPGEVGGRNCSLVGPTAVTGLLIGSSDTALRFDTNDQANSALDLSGTTVVTYEALVNLDTGGSNALADPELAEFAAPWFANTGSFTIDINNSTSGESGTISLGFCGTGSTLIRGTIPRASLVDGAMHHFAVVFKQGSPGVIKAYIDGVAVTVTMRDTGASGTPGFANSTLWLMSRGGSTQYVDGTLQHVAIYPTELSSGRVAAHAALTIAATGNTLYVDADHADADDAGDRNAARNPATPLETIGRAMVLAELGDTIQVKPATNANPADTADASVYELVGDDTFGGDAIPNKDASGGRITIEGIEVSGQKPKWRGINSSDLTNWKITGFQLGYDMDSGDEYLTSNSLRSLTDCEFTNNTYTGGIANLLGFFGTCRWEGNTIHSRLRDIPNPNFMEGVGIRILADDGGDRINGPDDRCEFVGNNFFDVQGEDAIQIVCAIGHGRVLVEGCDFGEIRQTGFAHTDAIQSTGCEELIVRNCTFGVSGVVDSMIISSDGNINNLVIENNLFVGSANTGFSVQVAGVVSWLVRHNTWAISRYAGFRFFENSNLPDTYGGQIYNNIIDIYQVDIPITWDETEQHNNIIGIGYRTSTDTEGFSDFGSTEDTDFELSNSPVNTPGVDMGSTSDLILDRLGRSRKGSAPDCGCHESDPSVVVLAGPRSPRIVDRIPGGGQTGVAVNTNVVATIAPKPGQQIDPSTAIAANAYVRDVTGQLIPGIVTLSELGLDGKQTITIDLKYNAGTLEEGTLYPLVAYTAHMTTGIKDTEGSPLFYSEWSFRIAGPSGSAIYRTVGDTGGDVSFVPWAPIPEGAIPSNDQLLLNLSRESGEPTAGFITANDIATIVDGLMQRLHYSHKIVVTQPGDSAPVASDYTEGQLWVEIVSGTPNSKLYVMSSSSWTLLTIP